MCARIAVCALLQNAFQGPNYDGSRKSHTHTSLYIIRFKRTYTHVYTVYYTFAYIHKYISEGGENIYICI